MEARERLARADAAADEGRVADGGAAAAVDPLRAARLAGGRRRQAALVPRQPARSTGEDAAAPRRGYSSHISHPAPPSSLVQAIVANATQFMHQFVDDDLERKVMLGLLKRYHENVLFEHDDGTAFNARARRS